MNIGKIKNHRMAVLEQACERYAVMAFETMNGRLAIGLRSITHSYDDHEHMPNRGTFHAIFRPWNESDCPNREGRIVDVGFDVEPQPDGTWKLLQGSVTVQGDPKWYTISWSADGQSMKFSDPEQKDIYSQGADQNQSYASMVKV